MTEGVLVRGHQNSLSGDVRGSRAAGVVIQGDQRQVATVLPISSGKEKLLFLISVNFDIRKYYHTGQG